MNRRDTILVAAFVNAGLLALLFIISMNPSTEPGVQFFEPLTEVAQAPPLEVSQEETVTPSFTESAVVDEVDQALSNFVAVQKEPEKALPEMIQSAEENAFTEIIVKRGDVLERIARANGTSVKELKKINQLFSERIDIGQVLRVPLNQKKIASTTPEKQSSLEVENDQEYYTIKNGDNPWKIAKQFNVRFDELLDLNQLNEERARNLKAGDKIRVH